MKQILISVLLAVVSPQLMASGNPGAGKNTAIICIGCHGADGNSTASHYPSLAGQGQNYIIKQLKDFKSGARKEQHMSSMVEAIRMQDIPNLAAWFNSQKLRKRQQDKFNQPGKQIFANGIEGRVVSACAGCHGDHGKGNDTVGFPALAGQHAEYLIKQLKDFRSGKRQNDNMMMQAVTKELSDSEIKALAEYIEAM